VARPTANLQPAPGNPKVVLNSRGVPALSKPKNGMGGGMSAAGTGGMNGKNKPPAAAPATPYDYAGELQKQLSPLQQQITDLQNAKAQQPEGDWKSEMTKMFDQFRAEQQTQAKTQTATSGGGITSDGGGLTKEGYSYNPTGNTTAPPVNNSASVFDNWLRSETTNRASTAYQFAPGGTRRQDEPAGAANAADANGSNDAMRYWRPNEDSVLNPDSEQEERDRRARAFASSTMDALRNGQVQSSV
jgi:TolA-binding protein